MHQRTLGQQGLTVSALGYGSRISAATWHLPRSVAEECSARLVPEGTGVQADQVSLTGAIARVTTTYIETTDDHAIPLAAQRKMAREAGCGTVLSIESDHSPMLSHVVELASLLLTLGSVETGTPRGA